MYLLCESFRRGEILQELDEYISVELALSYFYNIWSEESMTNPKFCVLEKALMNLSSV